MIIKVPTSVNYYSKPTKEQFLELGLKLGDILLISSTKKQLNGCFFEVSEVNVPIDVDDRTVAEPRPNKYYKPESWRARHVRPHDGYNFKGTKKRIPEHMISGSIRCKLVTSLFNRHPEEKLLITWFDIVSKNYVLDKPDIAELGMVYSKFNDMFNFISKKYGFSFAENNTQ